MPLIHILELALIQGVTEFLPVSSSGHLILFSSLNHLKDQGIEIDIALHIGSLLAVLIYFAPMICKMFQEMWQSKLRPDFHQSGNKLFWMLIIASIPALVVGFLLRNYGMEFLRTPKIIGFTILFYGIVLYVADRFSSAQKDLGSMTLKDSLLIGLAQCLALVPGTSRSGITITMARFLKINRVDAAKFSMLLSVPVIAAAGALEGYRLFKTSNLAALSDCFYAVLFSFIISYGVIYLMMKWLQRWSYLPFVIYRIALGVAVILTVF